MRRQLKLKVAQELATKYGTTVADVRRRAVMPRFHHSFHSTKDGRFFRYVYMPRRPGLLNTAMIFEDDLEEIPDDNTGKK